MCTHLAEVSNIRRRDDRLGHYCVAGRVLPVEVGNDTNGMVTQDTDASSYITHMIMDGKEENLYSVH